MREILVFYLGPWDARELTVDHVPERIRIPAPAPVACWPLENQLSESEMRIAGEYVPCLVLGHRGRDDVGRMVYRWII